MAKEFSSKDTRILWILVALEGLSALGLLVFFRLIVFAKIFKWNVRDHGLDWFEFLQDLTFVGSSVLWLLGVIVCVMFTLLRRPSFDTSFIRWATASALLPPVAFACLVIAGRMFFPFLRQVLGD